MEKKHGYDNISTYYKQNIDIVSFILTQDCHRVLIFNFEVNKTMQQKKKSNILYQNERVTL